MAIFPDSSIWLEHLQWESKFSPQIIHSSTQSQLFSNFGCFQTQNDCLEDDFDYNSFINTISSQLSNDVFQSLMKIVYTDKIYKSLQMKRDCPMHVEKEKSKLRKTKSLIYEQPPSIFDEQEDFINIDQINFCDYDDSCGFCDDKNKSFNSFS